MCISHLPEEILQYIASFLSPHDVTRLSMTCHQIKKILPVFLRKNGPDINQLGPRDGHWTPEFYFNSPKFTSRPKKVTISISFSILAAAILSSLDSLRFLNQLFDVFCWTLFLSPNSTELIEELCCCKGCLKNTLD